MKKIIPIIIAIAIAAFLYLKLNKETPVVNSPKTIDEFTVHTSFYPFAFMTQEVFDDINVVNLAGAVDVHEYIATPQDIKDLYVSHLVIYDGDLETWSKDLIPQLKAKNIPTLIATKGIEKISFDDSGLSSATSDADDDHGDTHEDDHHDHEDAHEDDHHDHEEGHHHGTLDPHVWLDPNLAKIITKNIYNKVIRLNQFKKFLSEEKLKHYKANYQNLLSRFDKLDQQYKTGLSNCRQNKIITSHDAYSYLAKRYHFTLLPIVGISTLDTPSAKSLIELKNLATENQIKYLMVENNGSKKFSDALSSEANLKSLTINPLGRGTLDEKKDFFDVMEDNLQNLSIAMECD